MKNTDKIILDETTNIAMFHGYKIYQNGDIVSPHGNTLSAYTLTYPGSHITIKIKGKMHKRNKARLVYAAFSKEKVNLNQYIIKFKDGDTYNTAFSNLYLVSRKEYYMEKECRGQTKFTDDVRREIRMDYQTGEFSIRKLCSKYQCSLLTMQKILREMS